MSTRREFVQLGALTTDRPWPEHYCRVIVARRDYVKAHPAARGSAFRIIDELRRGLKA